MSSAEPQRVIDLSTNFALPDPEYDYFDETRRGDTVETRWRIGNRLFTKQVTHTVGEGRSRTVVEEQVMDARVDYRKIHASTEVVADYNEHMSPWEHSDGWEHTLMTLNQWLSDRDDLPGMSYEDAQSQFRSQRGYISYSQITNSGSFVIVPDYDCLSKAPYYRNKGCSKQVAAELVAYEKRRMLNQLVQWYRYGWSWFGVKCEYEGYEASLWGIDDAEYAAKEITHDVAADVAYQMEQVGCLITHRPRKGKLVGKTGYTKQGYLEHLRNRMRWYGTVGYEGDS